LKQLLEPAGKRCPIGGALSGSLRRLLKICLDVRADGIGIPAEFLDQGRRDAVFLLQKGEQQGFHVERGLLVPLGDGLSLLQGCLGFDGQLVESHGFKRGLERPTLKKP
jgi:hypothetical protein